MTVLVKTKVKREDGGRKAIFDSLRGRMATSFPFEFIFIFFFETMMGLAFTFLNIDSNVARSRRRVSKGFIGLLIFHLEN